MDNGSSLATRVAAASAVRQLTTSATSDPLPAVITVAVTGDVHDKTRVPTVPITPEEQIADIHECFEAGARMVHVHVRDDQGRCTWDPELYQQVMDGCKKYCPEMIMQFSTGNYANSREERLACVRLGPDMASLCPGSVNFRPSRPGEYNMYIITHDHIISLAEEMKAHRVRPDMALFDLAHVYATADMVRAGLIETPVRAMFVLGGHMALDAQEHVLAFLVSEAERVLGKENLTWCAVGIGWGHYTIMDWCVKAGGQPRTGFEDTLMIRRGVLAESNRQLVEKTADLCAKYDRPIATPAQARHILGLDPR